MDRLVQPVIVEILDREVILDSLVLRDR